MTPDVINIISAEHSGGYRIHLKFDDGSEQLVDFGPFLTQSIHPDIRAYLDGDRFAAFRLDHGDLVWGDHDLCFPIADLYINKLIHKDPLEAVA